MKLKINKYILKNLFNAVFFTFTSFFCASIIPVLALPARIFSPLPVLYYTLKLGRKFGIYTILITLTLYSLLFKNLGDVFFVIFGFMFTGLILAELIKKKFDIEIFFLISCTLILIYISLCFFYLSFKLEIDIISLVSEHLNRNINNFLIFCKDANINNDLTLLLKYQKETVLDIALMIMPSILVATVFLTIWINIIFFNFLTNKNKKLFVNINNLNCWYAPENLIWALICFGLTLPINIKIIKYIGINGLIVILFTYFLQGISVVSFYLEKKKVSILIKVPVYFMISINQLVFLIIIGIGLTDIWFNFRKITKYNQ